MNMSAAIELIKSHAELIVSLCAVLVSLCALIATIVELKATRKHNRISVKPRLTAFTYIDTDPADSSIKSFKVTLMNNGLGPAIIKTWEVLFNDEVIPLAEHTDIFPAVVKATGANLVWGTCRSAILRKHYVMAHGTELEIVFIAVRDCTAGQAEAMKLFHLRVGYESAYGEPDTYDSRKHYD